jgi:hypothetical protein
MYRHTALTPALTILIAGVSIGVPAGLAATQVIGVAMSEGSILVNDARTPGNATILDGSFLQTESSASQVHFKDGAQLRVDADSRARLFSDHVDLQRGSVKISDYAAKANGLSVKAGDGSSANVTVKGKVIEVAALTGSVHVFNAAGLNVANLLPGRALDLTPQDAGASAPSSFTGCAIKSGNDLLLTDETSNVTAQLRGGKINPGERIQITGSLVPNATPAGSATQVLSVNSVKEIGGTCTAGGTNHPTPVAGSAAAAGGSTGGVGWSTPAIVTVAAIGAAGLGVGIAAATGAFSSSSTSPGK